MDPSQLVTLIESHQYLAAVMAGLLLLVALGKMPVAAPLWSRLPAWVRPLVPVMLGLVASVAQAILDGTPWLSALLSGVVVALPAVLAAIPSQVIHAAPIVVAADPAGDTERVSVTIKSAPVPPGAKE